MFLAVACGSKEASENAVWPIVTAYSILMNVRNPKNLTAFQKLYTLAAVSGQATDEVSFHYTYTYSEHGHVPENLIFPCFQVSANNTCML